MNCRLVDIEGILSLESFPADITVVEEHAGKVNCFEVVFDFGREFGLENIADGAMVFLHCRIAVDIHPQIADNVLCEVLRA